MLIDAPPQHADGWIPNIAEIYCRSHDVYVLKRAYTGGCKACLVLLLPLGYCCSCSCWCWQCSAKRLLDVRSFKIPRNTSD
jgi:hypothetical protein